MVANCAGVGVIRPHAARSDEWALLRCTTTARPATGMWLSSEKPCELKRTCATPEASETHWQSAHDESHGSPAPPVAS